MDDLSKAKIVVVVFFFVAVALFIKLCIQQKKRQGENLPVKITYYSPNCC